MKLSFTKMHGAGNDFVVLDGVSQHIELSPAQMRRIADRHRGVGCDQILLITAPDDPVADFRYSVFNSDGSRAGQCGNGARCAGRFLREKHLSRRKQLCLQTDQEPLLINMEEDGRVFAGLAAPRFKPEEIPFNAAAEALQYPLEIQGQSLSIGALSMGNPHAVLLVDSCERAPVAALGPLIEQHALFPERVNAGFMEIESRSQIQLRVYERGVGETEACGSGACAAVVHGIRSGLLDRSVVVQLPGGKLTVEWAGEDAPVWLGGPTATVYEGTLHLRG
jgi:diaminopimelate epimerase